VPLGEVLEQVVDELRAAWPERLIETRLEVTKTVSCDRARIAQLLSNLEANALTHGASEEPIRIHALTLDGTFELSVANQGEPIPAATMERLFQPFFRVAVRPSQKASGWASTLPTRLPAPMAALWTWPLTRKRRVLPSACRSPKRSKRPGQRCGMPANFHAAATAAQHAGALGCGSFGNRDTDDCGPQAVSEAGVRNTDLEEAG
jgi:hypothetical protein